MDECIFCKIVKGEIPCYKVFEDSNVLAFLDIAPCSDGHTVIIPKKHIDFFVMNITAQISLDMKHNQVLICI